MPRAEQAAAGPSPYERTRAHLRRILATTGAAGMAIASAYGCRRAPRPEPGPSTTSRPLTTTRPVPALPAAADAAAAQIARPDAGTADAALAHADARARGRTSSAARDDGGAAPAPHLIVGATEMAAAWPVDGHIRIHSRPSARVEVDGVLYGLTPQTVSVPEGIHDLTLTVPASPSSPARVKHIAVHVAAGGTINETVDLDE